MSLSASGMAGNSSGNHNDVEAASKQKSVVFTGHNAYMMAVARVCREGLKFTDVTFLCPDGRVAAHRLILAAASTTLKTMLKELPPTESESECAIIVPDVKRHVVASLVDFLYTGKMILSGSNSRDLQLLVRLLGIDPDNVRVEALEESSKKRLMQTQLTASMGLVLKHENGASPSVANDKANDVDKKPAAAASQPKTQSDDKGGKSSRGVKRRASQESSGNGKTAKGTKWAKDSEPKSAAVNSQTPNSGSKPVGTGAKKGAAKTRGRPSRPDRPSSAAIKTAISPETSAVLPPSGYHDMTNVETWVCAICRLYDPATLEGDNSGDTTEWIGCDCNRWYHKLCTGLAVVDESFCCAQVKLDCLPPSPKKKS